MSRRKYHKKSKNIFRNVEFKQSNKLRSVRTYKLTRKTNQKMKRTRFRLKRMILNVLLMKFKETFRKLMRIKPNRTLRTRRMKKLKWLKFKKSQTWMRLQSTFRKSGIGSRPKVNYLLKKEKERKERKAERKRSDFKLIFLNIQFQNIDIHSLSTYTSFFYRSLF